MYHKKNHQRISRNTNRSVSIFKISFKKWLVHSFIHSFILQIIIEHLSYELRIQGQTRNSPHPSSKKEKQTANKEMYDKMLGSD